MVHRVLWSDRGGVVPDLDVARAEDIEALVASGGVLHWLIIDCVAIGDVDYTASAVLLEVVKHADQHDVHLALSSVLAPVRQQLDRYGISKALGQNAYVDTPGQALEAFHSTMRLR